MKRSELVALVDMDGTLCDYEGAMQRDLERLRSPAEPVPSPADADAPWLRARRDLIRSQPGWWARLEPRKLGFDVLELLRALEFEVHILTKGPTASHAPAWSEKLQWCQQYVPDTRVTVTMDKGLVYGKVLVDDWPEYILRWLTWRPRGLVIVPANPWNEGFSHPNAIRYDGTNLDAVRERLRAVKAAAATTPAAPLE
ncbi:hypothetical protein JGU66_29520 [Myxococcaceae bacterium JPH2]|nr:hypothetical protein [Myxococcaceae bacterium JPH2]